MSRPWILAPVSILALTVISSLMVPLAAHAFPITVTFTVQGDPADPTYGTDTASGSFSFDNSLIPNPLPSVGTVDFHEPVSGLGLTSLSFTWAGHTWSRADADASYMVYNPAGLGGWTIGGAVSNFDGLNSGAYPDFILSAGEVAGYILYNTPSNQNFRGSLISWTTVPEPGTLLLLGPGLLALGLIRRRKN